MDLPHQTVLAALILFGPLGMLKQCVGYLLQQVFERQMQIRLVYNNIAEDGLHREGQKLKQLAEVKIAVRGGNALAVANEILADSLRESQLKNRSEFVLILPLAPAQLLIELSGDARFRHRVKLGEEIAEVLIAEFGFIHTEVKVHKHAA